MKNVSSMRVHLQDDGFLTASRRREIAALAARVVRGERNPAREMSIRLTTDAEIAQINAAFLNRPWPTDVISFPDGERMLDGTHSLGDIVISCETAAFNARRYRRSFYSELRRLVVHGTLHLLGHTHAKTAGEAKDLAAHRTMKRLERRYLSKKEKKQKTSARRRGARR